jgi:large subunit ribosomal protein L5
MSNKINPMREIRLEKVTLNIGTGEAGSKLETAKRLIEKLSGKKIVVTSTHKRSTFGVAKNRPIGVKVTLRGEKARTFLVNALKANENMLSPNQFDKHGNFSLGVKEYIDLPGVKYDPEIGILGMDVCATLTRAGYRVSRKKIRPSKIGKAHRITPDEAREWVQKEFGIKIASKEE